MARISTNKLSRTSNPEVSINAVPYKTEISSSDEEAYLKFFVRNCPRLVRKQIPRNHILPGELEDEVKDVSQMVLIKLWRKIKSGDGRIVNPYSYMTRTVISQCIDVARQNKRKPRPIQLPEDPDEELSQRNVLHYQNEGVGNPVLEYESKELFNEVLNNVAQLPPIQMKAMICLLKDEVDDIVPLAEAFAKRGIDIQDIEWPESKHELQKLRSSLSLARKKLRALIHR